MYLDPVAKLFCFWLFCCPLIGLNALISNRDELKERVKQMFYHAYDGYMKHAYPLDELRPLTCDGHDTWGSFSLTLVDALDTLAVMGNWTEFNHASQLLLKHLDANRDVNVSVFETNIRVVGGLISAHLLSRRSGFQVEPTWPCSGPLLRKAELFASKLLPAFDTPTGMPYGTVNLALNAVPPNETTITCVAAVGTTILEFGTLSRLTGDPRYEAAAMRALRAVWKYRSSLGLLGNHIDVHTGHWTAVESTIGGAVDSLFEYLVKGAALFRMPELDAMFREYKKAIEAHLKHDDWYLVVNKNDGRVTKPQFQGLEAFWPGLLSLTGDLDNAIRHLTAYHEIWKQYGFVPEAYNVVTREVISGQESYHLRPEFIESVYYLYRATRDPMYIQMGVDVLTSIEHVTRTSCGYATIKDVQTHKLDNRMESFFLSETTKYLYLLFDEDNFLNELPGDRGLIVTSHLSPTGNQCYPELGGYIFNTEAHPIDPGSLNCCFGNNLAHYSNSVVNFESGLQSSHTNEDVATARDLEALRLAEEQFSPMETLVDLIDAVFQRHSPSYYSQPTIDQPVSWLNTAVSNSCLAVELLNPEVLDPQSDLKRIVLDALAESVSSKNSTSVFEDLDSIRPSLLTCPYPPFHQRYTYAGQMIFSVG
ncbi:ER degradation enhancing alpha-mannosidase like protein 2 [Paragonimus heterotremus]|uniref:alpha-1,2-Mannosidase n=1 Tax=Paragonimus heterotremus TaxID=100268 RepID=A0A8J4T1T2_9TREM|nr:ER degradation enhancing alpha-mannosidase like protein 2 [Paragonimus heterotremus]